MSATEPTPASASPGPGDAVPGGAAAEAAAAGLERLQSDRPEREMRADARRNYDKLLAAAWAAFAERGSDEVSLEEIARRAGVGIGTLYRHFPNRQCLLEAVYRDQVVALGGRAAKLLAAESPADALAEWLRELVVFSSTKRSLTRELLATLETESSFLPVCKTVIGQSTSALLQRAQQTGDARADITGSDLIRLAQGMIMATDQAPGSSGELDRMLSVIVAGLRAS
ncbi:MAG TPA: TetR/AcrR family transcriptional regulator [Streptosporangiaceae bacterium]|nr:TetR/AcrR family transcriptional regulator [Streptosporangiaceae bacterium]